MMRRIRRVVGVVDARGVDADEAHSPIEEKVRPGSRQTGTVEQVGGRTPMPLPPASAKQDRVPLPDGAMRCAHGGPQVLRQDPAFLREAAKVETWPGAMNRSTGSSSSLRPFGSKWNGASTCVPVWLIRNMDSAKNPCTSRVVHCVKLGGG